MAGIFGLVFISPSIFSIYTLCTDVLCSEQKRIANKTPDSSYIEIRNTNVGVSLALRVNHYESYQKYYYTFNLKLNHQNEDMAPPNNTTLITNTNRNCSSVL